MSIGKRIQDRRELLQLSRNDFARRLGTSVSFIEEIEEGEVDVLKTTLEVIAYELGTTTSAFLE